MKIKKLVLLVFLTAFTLFATVSCNSSSILNDILRVGNDFKVSAVDYSSSTLESEDGGTETIYYSDNDYQVMILSDTDNTLRTFNELRLEIISIHETLVIERELIYNNYMSIKDSVSSLKELNFIVLEDDTEVIRSRIQNIKSIREEVLETKGEAYQRIYDLRGTYTRDNLESIIVVYQEVIEVLEYRLEAFRLGIVDLEFIDNLLLEYLEE
ncbi:MAG: hypothetical protein KAU02_02805 [Tenericutes bacterium]|nr:hypothetical protein [Mycoplasmatota bacterium]